ncbi:MAG TPA: hypothetical protein VF089_19310 [Candidatus Binatia bacterium]
MGLKEDISQPQSYYWERLPAENPAERRVRSGNWTNQITDGLRRNSEEFRMRVVLVDGAIAR